MKSSILLILAIIGSLVVLQHLYRFFQYLYIVTLGLVLAICYPLEFTEWVTNRSGQGVERLIDVVNAA